MTTKISQCIDTDLERARNLLSELVEDFSVSSDDSLGNTHIALDGRHSAIMVPQQQYTLLCNQSHYSFKFSLMAPGQAKILMLSGENNNRAIELDDKQSAFCFDIVPTTEVISVRLVSSTSDMVRVTIEPCVEL